MVCHKLICTLALVADLCGRGRLHAQDVLVTGLEQLSALKGYIHTVEEGYRIVTDGLHLIGDIKGGEVTLHRVFFGSLREVDEAVWNDPGPVAAYAEAVATNRCLDQAVKGYAASGWLSAPEVRYLTALERQVASDGRANTRALEVLLADGKLSMTDGERLQCIRRQQMAIRARYVDVMRYAMELRGLVTARAKEQGFTGILKTWYGIQ